MDVVGNAANVITQSTGIPLHDAVSVGASNTQDDDGRDVCSRGLGRRVLNATLSGEASTHYSKTSTRSPTTSKPHWGFLNIESSNTNTYIPRHPHVKLKFTRAVASIRERV